MPVCMADDSMLNRIGRVAKDKLGKGKDWVDSGASSDSGLNVRGAASGAVLGGLVLGPLGAVVGGWLGKGAGLSKKAEEEALAGVGMTREDAMRMKDLVTDLQGMEDGLSLLRERVRDLKNKVQTFTKSVEANTESAKQCLMNDDEEGARKYLAAKLEAQKQLQAAEDSFVEERNREDQQRMVRRQLEEAILMIEDRATRRLSGSLDDPMSGGAMDGTFRDPLLDKFDAWEREDKDKGK